MVKKSYARLSWFIFFVYPVAIIAVIYAGVEMNSYAMTQTAITLVETALGVYVAQVVMDLFKAKE